MTRTTLRSEPIGAAWALGLVALLATGCASSPMPAAQPAARGSQARASLLLFNGVIDLGDVAHTTVDALAVAGGRVLAHGSVDRLGPHIGPRTRRVDLHGAYAMPGFFDAHVHLEHGGRQLQTLDLRGCTSLAQVEKRVAARAKASTRGAWIIGSGWDHTRWPKLAGSWPTREPLDRAAPDNPVYLSRVDGHVAWVNGRALALAKIDASTVAPAGGRIVRGAGGRPTGILEERAMRLVKPARASRAQRRAAIERALDHARRLGITSVADFGSSFEVLDSLAREGRLTARVVSWSALDGDFAAHAARQRRRPADDPWLAVRGLKGFVDGTLGSATAALLEPYAGDRERARGVLRLSKERLRALASEATRRGYQLVLHAIGDRAVRLSLEAIDHANHTHAGRGAGLRHRLEHLQVVHPDDIARIKSLGVIASIQPCHLSSDQRWVDDRLGDTRASRRGYRWRELADRGVPLALGTDWPVEPLDPLRNLYVAITRRRLDHPRQAGWGAAQRLELAGALRAYTYGSAYAAHLERQRGTLTRGQLADIVVLDRQLLRLDRPEALLETKVLATIVDGRFVFTASGWQPSAR